MTWHKIIIGDCLEAMKKLSDESIDVVLTSPPYYAGKEYEDKLKTEVGWESYIEFLLDIFIGAHRIIKDGGHLWINIDDVHTSLKSKFRRNKVLPTHAILISELSKRYDYKEMILWRKIRGKHASGGSSRLLGSYGRFGSPGSIPIVQECEYILWFKKRGNRKDITDERRKKSALTNEEFRKYGMQIWDIPPERAKIGHPTPFPIEIPERIIKLASFENDLILDPFAGSFTTAKVAKDLGRNSISIEINPRYWEEIGRKRLQVDTPSLDNSMKFEVTYLDKKLEVANAYP